MSIQGVHQKFLEGCTPGAWSFFKYLSQKKNKNLKPNEKKDMIIP